MRMAAGLRRTASSSRLIRSSRERWAKLFHLGGKTNVNVQDGTFSAVSSHRANDGLAVGRHKVVIVSFKKGSIGAPVRGGTSRLSQRVVDAIGS